MTLATYKDLCIDVNDAAVEASFWATALDLQRDGNGALRGPTPQHTVWFNENRVHWDVYGNSHALRSAGAKLLRPRDDDLPWDVLADPEGNEFCVFVED